ncbi:hypothetical protein FAGAP_13275 [Fusarium agapanthi]|uniref:Uncharacterized protein n=1 Tax=Fusarium agapanthi TaxID=1803897 RepID=A0A9P5AWA2_9HYPO|nr:hypothetical protein FAGAP_13275 [Fusarium agapanthi]
MSTQEYPIAPKASLLGLPFELREQIYHEYFTDWRKQAASVNYITRHHVTFQHAMLARLKRLVTSEMYENPDPKYSQYLSVIKKDIAKAAALFDRHPNVPWDQNVFETLRASREGGNFFDLGFDPWAIPSVAEVKDKWGKLRLSFLWERLENWYQMPWKVDGYTGPEYRYKRKYRFSAASVAISLLGHLSQQQRLSVSKIILKDRYAVGNPECHILGLIPFFQENPNLYIEHRVSLWRNIVPISGFLNAELISVEDQGDIRGDTDLPTMHQIYSSWSGAVITNIIMHTSQALREGLPSRSYSLAFDGDPALNYSTDFFSTIMKPHIAWLTANTDCVAQGILLPREHFNYPFDTRRSVEGICPAEEETTL